MVRDSVKISTLIFVLFTLFLSTITINAEVNSEVNPEENVDYGQSSVYDFAEKLSEQEEENINKEISESANKLNMNIAIVITDDLGEKTSKEYADDFYNEEYGIDTDGVLLLIHYATRNNTDNDVDTDNDSESEMKNNYTSYNCILTSGNMVERYNDSDINDIFDEITPKIVEGNLEDACLTFVSSLHFDWGATIMGGILISIIIAIFIGLSISKRYNLHKTLSATNYICDNKSKFLENNDTFIRSYIRSTPIPRNDSSFTHIYGGRGRRR